MNRKEFRGWLCIDRACESEAGCGCLEAYDAIIEECARVAEAYRSDNPFPTLHDAIAAAIRALKDKTP